MSKYGWTCNLCDRTHVGDITKKNKARMRVVNCEDDLTFEPSNEGNDCLSCHLSCCVILILNLLLSPIPQLKLI